MLLNLSLIFLSIAYINSSLNPFNLSLRPSRLYTAISAAWEGVAALKSAVKSAMVKSVSCPIPVIIGVLEVAIAIATSSSLKAHSSSIEPPPLARIITSISSILLRTLMPLEMSLLALIP